VRFRLYLFLLLTLFLIPVTHLSAPSTWAESPKRILVLGDSLSAGYGMDLAQAWPSLLQTHFQAQAEWQLINASVSGETTLGGKTRLPALLATYQPQIVILELGGNDALRGQPLKLMHANLQAMVEMSDQAGAQVLLVGMQIPPNFGPRYTREFAALYPALAEANHLPLVPFLLAGVASDPELMQADGLHATAAAQPRLLANVWPLLAPLLGTKVQAGANTQTGSK